VECGKYESTWNVSHLLASCSRSDDRWVQSMWQNKNWQTKQRYCDETCPRATLFTTNITLLDLRSKPGHRIRTPATNRLNYRTNFVIVSVNICNAAVTPPSKFWLSFTAQDPESWDRILFEAYILKICFVSEHVLPCVRKRLTTGWFLSYNFLWKSRKRIPKHWKKKKGLGPHLCISG
jgi:hypothetical protein